MLGQEHPDTLTRTANLASTYREQERWKYLEGPEVQVMETRNKALDQENSDVLANSVNFASTFWDQRWSKEVEELDVPIFETFSW